MKFTYLRFFLLFITISLLTSCSSDSSSPETENLVSSSQNQNPEFTYTAYEDETLDIINSYRKSIGLNTLEKNNYISVESELHDEYMITNNEVSHDLFEERYKKITTTLGAKKVGENIAYNYNTPQAALDAWLKSPKHKECIEGDYTHFGIAIRVNSNGKKYYTNIFMKL